MAALATLLSADQPCATAPLGHPPPHVRHGIRRPAGPPSEWCLASPRPCSARPRRPSVGCAGCGSSCSERCRRGPNTTPTRWRSCPPTRSCWRTFVLAAEDPRRRRPRSAPPPREGRTWRGRPSPAAHSHSASVGRRKPSAATSHATPRSSTWWAGHKPDPAEAVSHQRTASNQVTAGAGRSSPSSRSPLTGAYRGPGHVERQEHDVTFRSGASVAHGEHAAWDGEDAWKWPGHAETLLPVEQTGARSGPTWPLVLDRRSFPGFSPHSRPRGDADAGHTPQRQARQPSAAGRAAGEGARGGIA